LEVGAGNGKEKEVNAVSAATWSNNGSFQYRLSDDINMANVQGGAGRPLMVALEKQGDNFTGQIYDAGTMAWLLVHTQAIPNMGPDPSVGLFLCGHTAGHLETAHFWDTVYTTNLADPLPAPTAAPTLPASFPNPSQNPHPARNPGDPVQDPEGVAPVAGGWGVLEVTSRGNMGGLGAALDALYDGGIRYQYNLMGPINVNDHEGSAANFPNDIGYGSRYAGRPGNIDDIAFLARGTVVIPADGEYSFYVRSDDGEEMTVTQGATKLVIGDDASWQTNCFGTVALTAGYANIQVIHREDGGGANVEVAAAPGNTTDLADFTLIGQPSVPARTSYIPRLYEPANMHQSLPGESGTIQAPGGPALALAAVATSMTNQTISSMTVDVINHDDPDGGGPGRFPGDLPLPYDAVGPANGTGGVTGTADDDFGLLVEGILDIAVEDNYLIGYRGDDGGALQLLGGNQWLGIVEDATGVAAIITTTTLDDTLITDANTGDSTTVGEVHLTVGQHPFNLVFFERGGGAYVEMFGGTVKGYYDLITLAGQPPIDIPEIEGGLQLIPEPATLALLGIGLVALIRRKR